MDIVSLFNAVPMLNVPALEKRWLNVSLKPAHGG